MILEWNIRHILPQPPNISQEQHYMFYQLQTVYMIFTKPFRTKVLFWYVCLALLLTCFSLCLSQINSWEGRPSFFISGPGPQSDWSGSFAVSVCAFIQLHRQIETPLSQQAELCVLQCDWCNPCSAGKAANLQSLKKKKHTDTSLNSAFSLGLFHRSQSAMQGANLG